MKRDRSVQRVIEIVDSTKSTSLRSLDSAVSSILYSLQNVTMQLAAVNEDLLPFSENLLVVPLIAEIDRLISRLQDSYLPLYFQIQRQLEGEIRLFVSHYDSTQEGFSVFSPSKEQTLEWMLSVRESVKREAIAKESEIFLLREQSRSGVFPGIQAGCFDFTLVVQWQRLLEMERLLQQSG